jgi:hypothetical protein
LQITLCAPFEDYLNLQRNRKPSAHRTDDYKKSKLNKKVFKMKYSFTGIQPTTETVYPNTEAHAELKAMMNRGERVNFSFGIDRFGFEVAYPQSQTTDWFGYQLNPESMAWILRYLTNGETEDFNVNPAEVVKSEYATKNAFVADMLKMFVENKLGNIQFTPQLRDRSGKISAIASFRHGIVSFRVERTEQMVEYLRDKGLIR